MQNLREQLLKAGLISESDKKKADEAARSASRPGSRPAGGRNTPPEARSASGRPGGGRSSQAPIPRLPPLADPNNKEFQRQEAKKQLELNRQIRELVVATQVPVEPGTHTFYFVTRKNRLRRIEMTPEQAQLLETGKLAVVERPEPAQIEHSLVPPETAEKLLTLSEKAVRFYNRAAAPVGFLTDEEIARRQKVESDRTGEIATATGPEDTGDDTPMESPAPKHDGATESESLVQRAERAAPATTDDDSIG
ncbi:MAG: DUF2058 family protein [Myxococcaceae bacterium]|nr:DUF2058 family protein [Myxococcaceae bacterium]